MACPSGSVGGEALRENCCSSAKGSSGPTQNLNCEWGCSFDEHCNESQAECGSDEMLSGLSTESCTDQGENRALTYVFWCSAQCPFLIGGSNFCMRWASAVQHAMLVRRMPSFPQQDASGNSPAAGRMDK